MSDIFRIGIYYRFSLFHDISEVMSQSYNIYMYIYIYIYSLIKIFLSVEYIFTLDSRLKDK